MDLTLWFRRFALLGIVLFASLNANSHRTENTVSRIIGKQFDVERVSDIEDLKDECRVLETYEGPLSDSCVEKLADHFSDQPVWEQQSLVFYPHADRWGIAATALNKRPWALKFSQSEFTGDVPRWRDIFDGNVTERERIVNQVFQDETCLDLRERGAIRADSDLSVRCQSRELVKYAIYLDACLTGVERIDDLFVRRTRDGQNRYELANNIWDRELSGEESENQKAELNETMMHAIWMRNACEHMPIEGYDNAFRTYGWNSEGMTFDEMAEELQTTHDTAMSIAARSGDAWAIRGFYVNKLRRDVDYWKSLYPIDPLLFHRWMTELGSVYDLSEEERAMHAMKAYELEKDVLDDPDLDHYIHRHGIWPESENILSLREWPIEDDQLLKKWVGVEVAEN